MRRYACGARWSLLAAMVLFITAISGCGGGGGSGPAPVDPVLVNNLDGEADVPVDSQFEYLFDKLVEGSTVTGQSYFILPTPAAAAQVAGKGAIDPAVCDPEKAIDALAAASADAASATLVPAANLSEGVGYTICLTSDILYADGTPFEGFMAQFTTAGTAYYTVGGTVAGLGEGESVVLQNNEADDLTVSANGAFTFSTALADASDYEVTVKTAPAGGSCSVDNAAGTIAAANVTDVSVLCVSSWSNSTVSAGKSSIFNDVAVDAEGSSYAVGYITSTGAFDFGSGVIGASAWNMTNAVIVKYGLDGQPLWAKTTGAGQNQSEFVGVAVSQDGEAYAVGYLTDIDGSGLNFVEGSPELLVQSPYNAGKSLLIVKYGSDGTPQWARTVDAAQNASEFADVAVASDGSVYAVGSITGDKKFGFGDGIEATSPHAAPGQSVLVVRYNSSGAAKWAATVDSGTTSSSEFFGVAVDSKKSVYAVGRMLNGVVDFGNGKAVPEEGVGDIYRVLLVKYDLFGTTRWAKSVSPPVGKDSEYSGVAVDSSDVVSAVGYIEGDGSFNFGGSAASVKGKSTVTNSVIVSYSNSSGDARWGRSTVAAAAGSEFLDVATDAENNSYAVGLIKGVDNFDFGSGVINGAFGGVNPVMVGYASDGSVKSAVTTVVAPDSSRFRGAAVGLGVLPIAAGNVWGDGSFNLGNGVSVSGAFNDPLGVLDYNAVIASFPLE